MAGVKPIAPATPIMNNDIASVPFQDMHQVHCFGCGALNAYGLRIKSFREVGEFVCRWTPQPFHIGPPGHVFGGVIASVVDCNSVWAAIATLCDEGGHDLAAAAAPFTLITSKLSVNYVAAAEISKTLEVRARVQARTSRRMTVASRVLQEGVECANAEVIVVSRRPA
jgi:acyl-coenzyme A thioesterase PaaI-like protein